MAKSTPKTPPVVKVPKAPFKEIAMVFWKDAYTADTDDPQLNHIDDLTISIGVIVSENEKEITISTFWDGISETFGSPWHVIPKGIVKHIKRIKT